MKTWPYTVALILAAVIGTVQLALDIDWLRNLVRAIIVVEATLVFAAAAVIVRRYWANWRRDPNRSRLLPWHVVLLGIFTLGHSVSDAARSISAVDGEVRWFGSPLMLVAITAGLTGLLGMVLWLPHRGASAASNHPHGPGDPETVPPRLRR